MYRYNVNQQNVNAIQKNNNDVSINSKLNSTDTSYIKG